MNFRKNLSNLIGWNTKRRIVVFESDDWGSIRTRSKEDYNEMLKGGLEIQLSHFNKFDSLESNSDLNSLYTVLTNHKDSTGRPPVFTPMCLVANPNFEKIKENNFKEYFFESFPQTCQKYPEHDKVHELWLKGVKNRLFVPELHGREHINVIRWLKALQQGDKGLHLAFEHGSIGSTSFKNTILTEHLAAFHPETTKDIEYYKEVLKIAGILFEDICGYKPNHFIASKSSEPKVLELTLSEIGVKYLTRYKIQKYPRGNGKFDWQFNWLGKRNKIGQIYLTRNAGFEPSSSSDQHVKNCLLEIENAFKWNKPAIVSTHRVNYIGFIDGSNREKGLNKLDELLSSIIKKWPNVEFMTSTELGNLIRYEQ